jgi:hypothetical protein
MAPTSYSAARLMIRLVLPRASEPTDPLSRLRIPTSVRPHGPRAFLSIRLCDIKNPGVSMDIPITPQKL